jgi:type II secretory pathway pseudopilin PulG
VNINFVQKNIQTNASKTNRDKGFTIIETLTAIFILLISITGPMAFSQNGLRAAFQARDQITAFYLAQDAIEFIKNQRDTNILNGELLLSRLGDCTTGNGCTIDTLDGGIAECTTLEPGCLGPDEDGSEDNPLRIDGDGYFVTDSNYTEESIFSRHIYINKTSGSGIEEAEIIVKVRWVSQDTIGAREITVVEYINNWLTELGL